jgi:nitrite reductase/ring-hydroxylating ferredoxin subunit
MFSEKTKYYRIADSKTALLDLLGTKNEAAINLPFGEVLVKHSDKGFVAFKNECPHQKLKLNSCRLDDNHIVCPWHQYKFNLENGRGHGLYLPVYPIIEKDDGLYLSRTYFSWFGE